MTNIEDGFYGEAKPIEWINQAQIMLTLARNGIENDDSTGSIYCVLEAMHFLEIAIVKLKDK